ncbi:MAG: hypothetical protein QNJ46_20650 [Leptolyngbyaceae cyanobacterium MO_188.B28]|nr:hypothetical protein [Leptolyngbyaceae cyanobacterium MO_188.B28]
MSRSQLTQNIPSTHPPIHPSTVFYWDLLQPSAPTRLPPWKHDSSRSAIAIGCDFDP